METQSTTYFYRIPFVTAIASFFGFVRIQTGDAVEIKRYEDLEKAYLFSQIQDICQKFVNTLPVVFLLQFVLDGS